ncbi:type VII secretion protein EsaA [Sporolactobacillus shoreae]|uniref:Type VII secretion protein EsaA n=1 Tax=Sporolactobacillus shoreae TaxID=1465501 RepID=A0A4Z0GTX2_9BACL|nr:type VII secretion protein EsaA [Sporolactobacillus shoreae]TGA99993.1 type VII secretion protein EsaA [Sporolactobacillus shoreae]
MNGKIIDRLKKWGSLAVIFIVIVCISGALPNYLTPPKAQPQQTANKNSSKTLVPAAPQTGALAIVNEDQGADVNGQRLNLGNQIVPLFSSGDDYNWETVSRSAADTGLKQGTYQAAIYIPSNFTSNIFTYTNSQPKAAVISYSANPKLTAEDAAKIQTEMQKVKGTLNQQFSKIYWRIISDKLSYIRGNFTDVVNKDKQYLQAMSDFYKPSSQNMAQVFSAQLNQINTLLAETKQSSSDAASQQTTLTDTKNQVNQQLDALNKLSDQLNQQIQSLQKTRDTNKQLVDDATTQSQDSLNKLLSAFNDGMVNPLNTAVTITDPLSAEGEFESLRSYYNSDNNKQYLANKSNIIALSTVISNYLVADTADPNYQNSLAQQSSTVNGDLTAQQTSDDNAYLALYKLYSSLLNYETGLESSATNSVDTSISSLNDAYDNLKLDPTRSDPIYPNHSEQDVSDLQDDIKKLSSYSVFQNDLGDVKGPLLSTTDLKKTYEQVSLNTFFDALGETKVALTNYETIFSNAPPNPDPTVSSTLDHSNFNQADTDIGNITSSTTKNLNTVLTDLTGENGITAYLSRVNPDDILKNMDSTSTAIQKKYDMDEATYSNALSDQHTALVALEKNLTSNMTDTQQQVASIAKPLVLTAPDPTFASVDNGFALSFKSNTFDQLNTIDQGLQNVSDNESAILKDSQNVQSLVNGVQSGANQLTGSWGQNLNATAELGSTISQTLGNTGEPGNRNQGAYQQLASPVNLAGLQLGNPNNAAQNQDQNAASTDTTPAAPVTQPFLTLLAVLIASILTGYFSYHYRNLSRTANALISAALALITSGVIIAYGVAQYGLEGGAVIMWSLFTIGLIAVISAWVREAYQLSEIVGVLLIATLVVYFTLPLLKNSMDRFAYQNPASDVYLAIAYGPDYAPFLKGIVAVLLLVIPVLAVIGIRAMIRHVREEKANETETF